MADQQDKSDVTVPATEAEIADAIMLSSDGDTAMAIRRLAFERDRLRNENAQLRGHLRDAGWRIIRTRSDAIHLSYYKFDVDSEPTPEELAEMGDADKSNHRAGVQYLGIANGRLPLDSAVDNYWKQPEATDG